MNTTHAPSFPASARRRSRSAATSLRIVLMTNALSSGAVGVVALVAPGTVDELLGTGRDGWIRLIGGVGFLVFAVAVFELARAPITTRARWAPLVSTFDTAYVIGTILAIVAGWFSTTGNWVMALTALLVTDFAIGQVWFARRVRLTESVTE